MKKLITGILLVVMMLSLAACGGDTADDDSSNTGAVYHLSLIHILQKKCRKCMQQKLGRQKAQKY